MISIMDILRHRHGLALPRAQTAAAAGVSTGAILHVLARLAGKRMVLSDTHRGNARAPRVLPHTDTAGRIFVPQFVVRATPTSPLPPRGRAWP